MANLIQIKRSINTATPGSLANGELAYTANGDVLYIGSAGTVEPISGKRYPGTLTANQALVANSTSYLDVIKTANLYIGSASVNQINATANTTHLGAAANNELPTTFAVKTYVDSSIAYTVTNNSSNTQVLFNDSGVVAGDAGMTYNAASDTLTVTNFSGDGALVTSVDAATVGGNTASTLRTYSDTTAATAYTNATSYTDTSSSTAYSNAMSDTLSRSGTYTGNNTFGGTETIINSLLTVTANAVIGDSVNDKIEFTSRVGSNLNPSANVTYSLGTNDLRWNEIHASNVHSVTGYFDGDLSVSGDLTVSGNVTYVSASELSIVDPLIHLAANNETSDTLDIGFIGHYSPDGGSTKAHTGFYRDAGDDSYYLFTGSEQANLDSGATTVDTGATGYTQALLHAYINTGALVSNSTVTNITANSTISVGITANTLALSTALAGTSGGTGLASYTAEDILVANSSNGFRKLGLGTLGYVLQSNGTALVYDSLDGGSF